MKGGTAFSMKVKIKVKDLTIELPLRAIIAILIVPAIVLLIVVLL